MDNNPTAAPHTVEPVQVPTQESGKKNNAFFARFGVIISILLIVVGLVFGGYYFGTHASSSKSETSPSPSPSPTTVKEIKQIPTLTQVPSLTPTSQKKTVKAGLSVSSVFKQYTIDVPDGWSDNHENNQTAGTDKLTLIKNSYTLTLSQAAFGGGGCVYKGDPTSEMAQTFTDFTGITGQSGQFRRSWNQDAGAKTAVYTVCQKNTSDNTYGSITSFGRIEVVAPNPADSTFLAELDTIIASIKAL